jgi:uncharacterized protein (DUF1330 family)
MAAYLVITAHIHDRAAFISGYAAAAAELVMRHGGTYLLRAPGATVLEGPGEDGASVVVSEWPDRQAALNFWNSEEYARIKKLRDGIADCSVMLVGD